MSTWQPPKPSHVCVICGALWKYHEDFTPQNHESWQLVSDSCGKCCDNVSMGDQILELKK